MIAETWPILALTQLGLSQIWYILNPSQSLYKERYEIPGIAPLMLAFRLEKT